MQNEEMFLPKKKRLEEFLKFTAAKIKNVVLSVHQNVIAIANHAS